MAVINHDQKWLYCMEPHTASRAINDALVKCPDCEEVGSHHEPPLSLVRQDRLGFDLISTVRNPLNVMVTLWRIGPGRHGSFRDWVLAGEGFESVLGGFWEHCNIICWYEDLQDDLNYVLGRAVPLGWEDWHKIPNKEPWQTYYEPDTFEIAVDYHRDFLDEFGYKLSLDGAVEITRKERLRKVGHGRR